MRFLGIDLGWRSQPTGVCALEWQNQQLVMVALDRCETIPEILDWIQTHAHQSTGIAVDAPTIITNPTGMRPCDRLTHVHFGKYDAGCYPANLGRPFAQRTIKFAEALLDWGFAHAPTIVPQSEGRWQIEVFPHPATVHLFGLGKIIKYKKGRLSDRCQGLTQLYTYIKHYLPQRYPPLAVSGLFLELQVPPLAELTGKQLKSIEDKLDSIVCAYVCAHWWYWGLAKNVVLGDGQTGFIVVPQPLADS
jgi:predicted RNase H-like nuclease